MRLEITCRALIYVQRIERVEQGGGGALINARISYADSTHPSNLYPTSRHAIIGFTRGRVATLCLRADANFGYGPVSNLQIRRSLY